MSTAPSNSTWTIVVFWWPWLREFILFDGAEFKTTVQAAAIPLGIGLIFFGAGYTGVFAGAVPAEHQTG